MADVLKIRGDLLGLGKTSIEPVKARKYPTAAILAVVTFALVLAGGATGAVHQVLIDREKAQQLAAAQAEAAEREKNRELNAKKDAISSKARTYQFRLEAERKRLVGEIENLEKHRETIPRVRQFLDQFRLPEQVKEEIGKPVDFSKATGGDTFELQVQKVENPQNVERERERWETQLGVVRRFVSGINANIRYFNGQGTLQLSDAFRREFGQAPAPAAVAPAEPAVETVAPAVPAVEPEPVAEAKPEPAPKPAARPAAPPKPRTVPAGNGGVQVTDW